jgi:hypothetical protein
MQTPVPSSRALFASAGLIAAIVVAATAVACDSDDATGPVVPQYTAALTGANERPNPVITSAVGSATIVKNTGSYAYTISYSGLSGVPSAAHIHGPADASGVALVIVPFTVTGAASGTGTLTGTFTSTNTAAISNDSLDVLMRTGNAYVNVHTAANGGGEIRGQLTKQ